MKTTFLTPWIAAAGLLMIGSGSHAALVPYSSLASFDAATTAQGTDTFANLSSGPLGSALTRVAGAYTYTASSNTALYGNSGPALSTEGFNSNISFSAFDPSVSAIGGDFFVSNVTGAFVAGQPLMLTVVDSLGASLTETVTPASISSFFGFTSTGTIASLTIAPVTGTLFPTSSALVLAAALPIATAVPEPETNVLLLSGLGILSLAAHRSRARSSV